MRSWVREGRGGGMAGEEGGLALGPEASLKPRGVEFILRVMEAIAGEGHDLSCFKVITQWVGHLAEGSRGRG